MKQTIISHALTACIVLVLVLGIALDKIVSGKVTVEPSHAAGWLW